MGLFGQSTEVGERIEEGEFEALHHVGYDGVGLWRREAIERLNGSRWNRISERFIVGIDGISGGGLRGEVEEDEEEERGGYKEEEVFGGQDFGGLTSPPGIRHGKIGISDGSSREECKLSPLQKEDIRL